ncbi:MAG: hypothetical protein K8S97_16655, partial [Anaerolineae bacterium]|nr:hypothetical protein [Anaerolineae bacterium]
PKQIVTLALTLTPTQVIVGGQAVEVAAPTSTAGPPRATPSLTPYVGVFIGQPTTESGEPAPTLAPFVVDTGMSGVVSGGAPVVGGNGCVASVAGMFNNAYAAVQERLGCPVNGGAGVYPMVTQPFERGAMFWRGDTRQIYTLATSGQFWQVPDSWAEGMPADDPAYGPPGGFLQPVRGFGLVWRSNGSIRDALGWATQPEAQYDGFWQDFERGSLFLGDNGRVYALFTAEGQHSGALSP